MNVYIKESLATGIIQPSSFPVGEGFFFVEKKDKTLRPYIGYRGLNDITIKNCYPLQFLSSAFELLQGTTILTKLDLSNPSFSVFWALPIFYRLFIHNYSSIAAPLNALTVPKCLSNGPLLMSNLLLRSMPWMWGFGCPLPKIDC